MSESLPPTTTAQEDETTAGQRRINLIWEYTQSAIALLVIMFNMGVAAFLAVVNRSEDHPQILSWTLALVVGFYFSRTNHAAIGGTGLKPISAYKGR